VIRNRLAQAALAVGGSLRLGIGFAAAALALGAPVSAPAQDLKVCGGREGTADQRIAACTRAIQSGKLPQTDLVVTLRNRGIEWTGKHDYDHAIADFDEAIRLDAQFVPAYRSRAIAWRGKRQYDRAIADYNEVIRLNPRDADAYGGRGYARFFAGRYAEAAQDFTESLRLDHNAYTAAWRFLASARGGNLQEARAALIAESAQLDDKSWPAPVLGFLLGKMDASALLKAAEHPNGKVRSEHVCEAEFYAAHGDLLQGRADEARARLRRAERGCPRTFGEYEGAVAELRRLGG